MKKTIKTILTSALLIVLTTIAQKSYSQTSWDLSGNTGTGTEKLGFTNTLNKSLKLYTNNSIRMTITGAGKIGIGTTSPSAILDIVKSGTTDLNVKSSDHTAKIVIDRGGALTGDSAFVEYRTQGGGGIQTRFQTGILDATGDYIIRGIGSGGGVTVSKSSGNVGIGSGPSTNKKLLVNGESQFIQDAQFDGAITSHGENVIGIVAASGVQISTLNIAGGAQTSGLVLTTTGGTGTTWSPPTGGVSGNGAAKRIAFWKDATSLSSNSNLFWDSTNFRLGIGTSTPATQLEINGQIKITGGTPGTGQVLTCDANGLATWETPPGAGTVSGSGAATRIAFWNGASTLTSSNILVYDAANNKLGVSTSAPDVRFHIGGSDDASLNDGSGEMVIGDINGTNVVFDNNEIIARNNAATSTLFFNNDGGDVIINGTNATGNVGIGTNAPTAKLSVNGTANKPGGGSWTSFSDSRLKKDIKPYEDGLNTVLKIVPVRYHYNELAGCDTKPEYVGVIAQDLKKIAPYMVGSFQKEGTEYFNVDNSAMTYTLINAVKEQQIQIEEKDARILLLEARMQQFENALSQCCLSFEKKTTDNIEAVANVASLDQNTPNPFSEATVIKFYIPKSSLSATIKIYSLDGRELKSISLSEKGFAQTKISGKTLSAGTYTYMLLVDEKVIDTKQMVLTK